MASQKLGIRSILLDRTSRYETCGEAETVIRNLENLHAVVSSIDKCGKMLRKSSEPIFDPVLVIGHPRSGTNFASHVLREHPRVSMAIEPFSMHLRFLVKNECAFWTSEDYDDVSMHQDLAPTSETARYLRDFRAWFYSQTGELRVLKETLFFLQMDWLKEYLPGIRVVYLERNPMAVMASFKKANFFDRWNYGERFELLSKTVRENEKLHEYLPLFGDQEDSWESKLAKMWFIRISEIRKQLSSFDHIAMEFEDLILDPHYFFDEILKFTGMQMDASVDNGIKARCTESKGGTYSTFRNPQEVLSSWKHNLSSDEKRVIRRITENAGRLGGVNGIRKIKKRTTG